MCESSIGLTFLLYGKALLNIAHIVVPIGMIIMIGLDLLKLVASQEVKLNEGLKLSTNRLIAGAIVFLLPYVVSFAFNLIGAASGSQTLYDQCYDTVNKDMITYYEQLEEQRYNEVLQELGVEPITNYQDKISYSVVDNPAYNSSGYTGSQTGSVTSAKKENNGVVLDLGNASVVSNITVQQLTKIIDSYSPNNRLSQFATTYVEDEKKYSVNAIVLVAIDGYESGWGNSPIATNCNNLGGYSGSGCSVAPSFQKFSSLSEYLEAHASLLSKSYLDPSGPYYEGTSIEAINVHYCVGDTWAGQVKLIANGLFNRL